MQDLIIPFTSYDQMLYNFNLCGDLVVFGLAIVENQDSITLEESIFEKVLDYMLERHPMLRANLNFDNENKISFRIKTAKEKLQFDKDLLWIGLSSKDHLENRLEEFTKLKFDYKSRLYRMIVFNFSEMGKQKYAISFWLPLFITDALNITTLTIEIVNIVNSLLTKSICREMTEKLNVIDNMFKITEKLGLIGEEQLKKIDEINNIKTSFFKFDSIFKRSQERGCKINYFNFDKNSSQNLIHLAKKNGVKFTAFLMTCLHYSIKELYEENNLENPVNVKFGLAANLRFRLKPIIDFSNIGYFSCLIPINTIYPKFGKYENIWEDSKYLDELIKENTDLNSGAFLNESHNFQAALELNKLFEKCENIEEISKYLSEGSTWDVMLSNAGTYLCQHKKQEPSGPFEIKELYFTDTQNSFPAIDTAVLIHLITWNDQLMFMISNNKSAISTDHMQRLIFLFRKFLLNLINR